MSNGHRATLSAIVLCSSILVLFFACKKDHPHNPPPPAKGSLQSQFGQCLPNTVHGTWYNGVSAEIDTNYVEINVHVTSPGSYTITSDRVNGVTFAASGIFSDTGMKMVKMEASGSFIQPGATEFHTSFDSTNCRFYVYPQDSAGRSIAENTWQFTAQGHTYRGTMVANVYTIPQAPGLSVQFLGKTTSGSPDTTLDIIFYTADQFIDTVSYPTSRTGISMAFYTSNGVTSKAIYTANSDQQPAVVDIHISSATVVLDPGYKNVVVGTFNGSVRDTAYKVVPITNAKFKVSY